MRLRLAFLVGALLGLLAACGATQSPGYGTTLFLTVRWDGAWDVASLFFIGQVGGHDAFPRSLRPEQPDASLSSPQRVRVLLADDLVGQPVDVQVVGYGPTGAFVVQGQATSAPIIQGGEVELTVNLDRAELSVDGGARDGGGGVSLDGGTGSCSCATGCCTHGACAPPGTVTPLDGGPSLPVLACGPLSAACTALCDPLEAFTCRSGRCTCGGSVCSAGQRCVFNGGAFQCVCDALSRCDGCCQGTGCVRAGLSDVGCGAAGLTCDGCGTGGRCTSQGVCTRPAVDGGSGLARSCDVTHCQSGTQCVGWSPGSFPTCRAQGLRGECVACDALRSDRCAPGNVTPIGNPPSPCSCGVSPTCALDKYCDRSAPVPTCKPLLQ